MGTRADPKTLLLAAAVSCALIAASVSFGLRVPAEESLSGIPRSSVFDYSRFPGELTPLSQNFIARTLGYAPTTGADADAATRAGGSPAGDAARSARTVVDHALTNDAIGDAYVIDSVPFTARTDTTRATRGNEPSGCALFGRTVWYRYRPQADQGLIVNTIGTKHATSVAVFTGRGATQLSPVKSACHSSVDGNAYVAFPAKKNTTYYFQVTDLAEGGPLVFNLDPAGTTEMVSLSVHGKHGNSSSGFTVISTGGRYVVFTSGASDLVANDTNGVEDVFVRDLVTGTTERVSVSSQGKQGDRESKPWPSAISADGRFVAFNSSATNLVPGDTNGAEDVFVHDRVTRVTTRVSVSSEGRQGSDPRDPFSIATGNALAADDDTDAFGGVSISDDGRFVAFDSELVGLVPGDNQGDETVIGSAGRDVFAHDRVTGRTSLVSRSSKGANGDALSLYPDISADGRYVAFGSAATNLIDGAREPGQPVVRSVTLLDVFVHDRETGRTERVSLGGAGEKANGQSFPPSISPDGRFVAFASVASNLVPGDTNEGIDVFVRDRVLRTTERVSVSSTGEQQYLGEMVERIKVNGPKPDMSADGRYVVFTSPASNLAPNDTNDAEAPGAATTCGSAASDIFVRDRSAGTTTRVSVSSAGTGGNGASNEPSISADGRRITFDSWASNLVAPGVDGGSGLSPCLHSSDSFVHTIPVLH